MMMLGVSRGSFSRVRPPATPTADATAADGHDDLRTARGIVNGVIFAVPLWAILGTLIWLLVAR
jgi:hypothetical protein